MTKRWALWGCTLQGLFAVLSVVALISSLGTAFQTLPLNPVTLSTLWQHAEAIVAEPEAPTTALA